MFKLIARGRSCTPVFVRGDGRAPPVCADVTVVAMHLRQRWTLPLLITLLWRLALLADARSFGRIGELHQRRAGRTMLNRDLSHDEIIRYFDKLYAHWPEGTRTQLMEEYKRRVLQKGWRWGIPHDDEHFLDLYYFLRNRTEVPSAHGWSQDKDRCAPGCHLYGTCNQEEGRCDCPRGRTGPDCSTPLATKCTDFCQHDGECIRITQELCINSCNQRGHCVSGTCHCYPGYFGSDCSLSIDYATNKTVILAGLNYEPNPRGPKIYVYEFPPQYHLWTLTWLDRPMNIILWERILALRLRTADPEEADYFFIPGCGRGCNRWNEKFQYITERYPKYWARRNGRDHLMTHAGDWGRCECEWGKPGKPYHQHLQNLTLLHLWGLTQDRSKEVENTMFGACHHPNKDIVLPGLNGDMFGEYQHNLWHPLRNVHPYKKTTLASVAGSLCGWNSASEPPCKSKYYSFGVRAALWTLLRDKPGFHIAKRVNSLGQSMVESEFCFTPTGAGFGRRNVMAVTLGCIPVTISDHVMQPYEPFMDWNDFGVIIPEEHINDVEEILRGFTMEQKAAKMDKLRCAAEHVTYSSVFGGLFQGSSGRLDAVATLVAVLRVRLRHPGVPDHQLMEVDAEFRDFMNCKLPPPGAEQLQQDQAPRPPAPPMPLAKDTSRYRPSSDDDAFPQRTVTTLGWVVAANGEREGRDHSAKGLGFFPGEKERDLCYFNGRGATWHDGLSAGPNPDELEEYKRLGYCLPREINRPGGFYPGSSVTCHPTRPITECEVLV